MEEDNAENSTVLPWCLLLHLLQPQHAGLGPEILRRRALWHPVCPVLSVVWHLSATRVCWILLWLQNSSTGRPSTHQQDPQADTRAALVYEPSVQHPDWRHLAFWSSLHRALLHPHIHVATPVLLPLRLPVPRLCDSHHHLCRNHNRAVLLSALQ